MARTTVTRAEVDAVWQAIADRGYDCSDLREALAEYAADMLASTQTAEEAVQAAERAFGVAPGSSWCAECREGGTEADWNSERCELCGGWLERT